MSIPNETAVRRAEQYRLMLLIEQMQRHGRSEREINDAVREATAERLGAPAGS